jgi:hypothetical protein
MRKCSALRFAGLSEVIPSNRLDSNQLQIILNIRGEVCGTQHKTQENVSLNNKIKWNDVLKGTAQFTNMQIIANGITN